MNIQQALKEIAKRDRVISELVDKLTVLENKEKLNVFGGEVQSTENELTVERLEALLKDEQAITKIAGYLSASMFEDEEVQENVHKRGLLSAAAPMDISFWIRLATQIIQILIEAFKK